MHLGLQTGHTVTVHGAPYGQKAYVQCGYPRGSFMTLQSLPQYHAAFSTIPSTLARVDHSPVSHLVVTLIRVSPPLLLPLPMRPRVQNPRNHEVRMRGWIYGRLIAMKVEDKEITLLM